MPAGLGIPVPGIAWVILNHAYSYHEERARRHVVTSISICMQKRTYSVQCSDKIHFPQLCIKCSLGKSCPGTHTALQVPMVLDHGRGQELLVKEPLHIQMTPSEECFNQNGGLEVPGCWTSVMRRQGGRNNPYHQPLTSNDVYPQ